MQNRKQAFDNISRQLGIIRHDIEQHQAIQDYSLNTHAENLFRDVFNWIYGCHFENANFQSANAPCLDLLDTQQKLAYQITSTTSKEKITNTLQALAKPEYQGYEIRMFYLLGKPNLSAKSKQEIRTDFALNIDEHLFDCSDLIKDIDNLETDKLIALNHKYFKETNQAQNDTTVNITSSTVHGLVAVAGQISNSFNETHYHHYAEKADTPIEVDTFHLPESTTALTGRKTELNQLTEAFKNPNKRLAIIVAAGGIGKSALTDEWLKQIEAHNYYGKTRVFGWSFYSQGSHNTFTNSQPFFSAVLPFLGVTEIPNDEIEKARVLARCLREQSCLLILDGLEPLQYAENLSAMNGEVQDSALKEFIACFRRMAGKSFVLLSSRQPLVELKKWQAEHYLSLDLETLPHEDGADLLQALGVTGNAEERQAISKDLNGHALSLVLMGHLLREHHQGDCRYAKELPPLTSAHGDSDAEKDSRHALRVLDYYDSLQDEASRCFLQLLGLFDRPMNAAEKAVLIDNANHAEALCALTAKQWQAKEQRLEKSGLLLGKKGSFDRLEWDTHPIIRAYFGDKFKENYPEAFKQGHLVLFDYYQKLPEKELPDTLEEMLSLYQAVIHGCLAGRYQQALDAVYYKRIRGNDAYKLGTYSQKLTALAAFFPLGWNNVINGLTEPAQSFVLSEAAFNFIKLGRFEEAIEIRISDLELSKKLEDSAGVALSAKSLTTIYLVLGNLTQANSVGLSAVRYSQDAILHYMYNGSSVSKEIAFSLSYYAAVYHCSGELEEAQGIFWQAEDLIADTEEPMLYSIPGYHYCDFLLDNIKNQSHMEFIIRRATDSLEGDIKASHLISIALDYLILARVYIAINDSDKAENYFSQAIKGMQNANDAEYAPLFYLYRADFYLTQNQLDSAQADLNSAWEIIERCGMKLYAVDYLLIHGRYCLTTKDHDTALDHYIEAKQLIQETGYHLRDAELDLFAAKLRQLDLPEHQRTNPGLYSQTADYYLQKAQSRIAEIGQWGLMRVIERDFPENSKGV